MPIDVTIAKTPKGIEYVRGESRGVVSTQEAHALMDSLWANGPHHDKALLAVVSPGSEFSKDARSVLAGKDPERNAKGIPIALVVASAPVRVMMSFIFKMADASSRSRAFATESEATAWLHSKLDA